MDLQPDGTMLGRSPAAEAGRGVCAGRQGGVSVVGADECDSGTGGGRAGDRDGDAAGDGRQAKASTRTFSLRLRKRA